MIEAIGITGLITCRAHRLQLEFYGVAIYIMSMVLAIQIVDIHLRVLFRIGIDTIFCEFGVLSHTSCGCIPSCSNMT